MTLTAPTRDDPKVSQSGATLAKMIRPRRRARGAVHLSLEAMADDLFRRALKDALQLDLVVQQAVAKPVSRRDVLDMLPPLSVRYVIGNASGAVGLIVACGTVIDAMIELETVGKVMPHPRGDRAVTQVDATMVEPLLLHVIGAFAQKTAHGAVEGLADPFAMRAAEFDPAQLDLTLRAQNYDMLGVTLDFGPGIKTGEVQIWLPSGGDVPAGTGLAETNPMIRDIMGQVETGLAGVIRGMRVPVGKLRGLKEGDTFDLKPDLLRQVMLQDATGCDVLVARLGQLDGARAVCVMGRPGARSSDTQLPDNFAPTLIGRDTAEPEPDDMQIEIAQVSPDIGVGIDVPVAEFDIET